MTNFILHLGFKLFGVVMMAQFNLAEICWAILGKEIKDLYLQLYPFCSHNHYFVQEAERMQVKGPKK